MVKEGRIAAAVCVCVCVRACVRACVRVCVCIVPYQQNTVDKSYIESMKTQQL